MIVAESTHQSDRTDDHMIALREAFFRYFNEDKLRDGFVIFLSAYLIDVRNNCDSLTGYATESIFLAKIAKKIDLRSQNMKKNTLREFLQFFAQKRPIWNRQKL